MRVLESKKRLAVSYVYMYIHSFIECCVHYCGLQIVHVSASFQLLSLFVRIVWSQSSL